MPEPDDHCYIDGYSIADDPYVQPNGVLTNLLTITTTAGLAEAEALFVPLRTVELWENPVPGAYDLTPPAADSLPAVPGHLPLGRPVPAGRYCQGHDLLSQA